MRFDDLTGLGRKTFYLIQGAAVCGLLSRPVIESLTGRDEIKNLAYHRRMEKRKNNVERSRSWGKRQS